MNAQLEFLAQVDLRAVAGFEQAVLRAGGWVLGRQLLAMAGKDCTEQALRDLRRLAARSEQVISGDSGYCHVTNASLDEIRHSADRLLSQVREMVRRVVRLRRAAHRRIHFPTQSTPVGEPPLAPAVLPEEISGRVSVCPHESEGANGEPDSTPPNTTDPSHD